jgi:anti-sigma factor (TIGR02949 family)
MTHNCDEALTNLYLYLDAELDKATADRIRSHLDACRGCSGSFDFERRLKAVVRTRLQEDVPEHLIRRIRQALILEASDEA